MGNEVVEVLFLEGDDVALECVMSAFILVVFCNLRELGAEWVSIVWNDTHHRTRLAFVTLNTHNEWLYRLGLSLGMVHPRNGVSQPNQAVWMLEDLFLLGIIFYDGSHEARSRNDTLVNGTD